MEGNGSSEQAAVLPLSYSKPSRLLHTRQHVNNMDARRTSLVILSQAARAHKRSSALLNRLFNDTSIQTSTFKKQRLRLQRSLLKEKEIKVQQERDALVKKQRMAVELYKDYKSK